MRRAFGLNETILSMALVGLLLVFVLNLFPSALAAQRGADQRLMAATLARSLLEQQLDRPFKDLPVGLRQELEPVEKGSVVYHIRLEVEAASGVDPGYLRILRLSVRWTHQGVEREVKRELWKHQLPHHKGR